MDHAGPTPFLHCWQADLAADHPAWATAPAWLSAAERARQARLRTPALRQAYGRAHGLLRGVLAAYTGLLPSNLTFATELRDKPVLVPPTVYFNLSYRASWALLALANHYPVGADVEPLVPLENAGALVAELFSGPEQAALRAAEPAAWWPLFYTIWTRKEAYAKALGMGLALPFAGFSVLATAGGRAPVLLVPAGAQLSSFAAGNGHVGAVAALGAAPLLVQHFDFLADFKLLFSSKL
ncbi:MAG: 4'-phosphopantetheinyl transferase family protein [Janthinobacterium lividum]